MGDAEYRDADRRQRSDANLHNEARVLIERVRAGLVAIEHVAVAAHLGAISARVALGEEATNRNEVEARRYAANVLGSGLQDASSLEQLIVGLGFWGRQWCIRAGATVLTAVRDARGFAWDLTEEHLIAAENFLLTGTLPTRSHGWSVVGDIGGHVLLAIATTDDRGASAACGLAVRYAVPIVGSVRLRLAIRTAVSQYALK